MVGVVSSISKGLIVNEPKLSCLWQHLGFLPSRYVRGRGSNSKAPSKVSVQVSYTISQETVRIHQPLKRLVNLLDSYINLSLS